MDQGEQSMEEIWKYILEDRIMLLWYFLYDIICYLKKPTKISSSDIECCNNTSSGYQTWSYIPQ